MVSMHEAMTVLIAGVPHERWDGDPLAQLLAERLDATYVIISFIHETVMGYCHICSLKEGVDRRVAT